MMQRRNLLHAGAVVLLLGRTELARSAATRSGPSIVAVRVWPADDYSRVTLESDAPLQAKQTFISQPPRLAVDIDNLTLNPTLRELVAKVQADDPNIAGIRVGQYTKTVVRMVIDLKQAIEPQVFALKPIEPYQHRLVFDLYPKVKASTDPLTTLIAEQLSQNQEADPKLPPVVSGPTGGKDIVGTGQAVPEVVDPLAELMAKQGKPAARGPVASKAPTPPEPPRASSGGSNSGTRRLIIIALDPGHGGEDPGAIGRDPAQ
jgi:N-acetylmuramoyl-L-alanine amidase